MKMNNDKNLNQELNEIKKLLINNKYDFSIDDWDNDYLLLTYKISNYFTFTFNFELRRGEVTHSIIKIYYKEIKIFNLSLFEIDEYLESNHRIFTLFYAGSDNIINFASAIIVNFIESFLLVIKDSNENNTPFIIINNNGRIIYHIINDMTNCLINNSSFYNFIKDSDEKNMLQNYYYKYK